MTLVKYEGSFLTHLYNLNRLSVKVVCPSLNNSSPTVYITHRLFLRCGSFFRRLAWLYLPKDMTTSESVEVDPAYMM